MPARVSGHHHWLVLAWLAGAGLLLAFVAFLLPNLSFVPILSGDDSQVRIFFDVNTEANGWTWFNVGLLFLAGLGQLGAGALARVQGQPVAWAWWVSGAVWLGLWMDDLTRLHERLDPLGRELGGGSGLTTAAWLVPGLVAAAVVVTALVLLARRLSSTPRWLLVGGLVVFLGTAFGLESIGNDVLANQGLGHLYAAFLYSEEVLEAWGAAMVVAGAAAAVAVQHDGGALRLEYTG